MSGADKGQTNAQIRAECLEVKKIYLPEKAEKTTKKKCFHCKKFITNILGRKGTCAYRDDNCRPVDKDEMEVLGLMKRVDLWRKQKEWKAHAEVSDFYKVFQNMFCGYENGAWLNPQGKIIGIRTSNENYHIDCFYEALTQKHGKDWKKEYEFQSALNEHIALQCPYRRTTERTDTEDFKKKVEQTIAARKIQRWFRRDVRHKVSDPRHPAGFAFMIRGMKECGLEDEDIAVLKLEFKLKRQSKQTKDFLKLIEKTDISGKMKKTA